MKKKTFMLLASLYASSAYSYDVMTGNYVEGAVGKANFENFCLGVLLKQWLGFRCWMSLRPVEWTLFAVLELHQLWRDEQSGLAAKRLCFLGQFVSVSSLGLVRLLGWSLTLFR